MNGIPLNPAQTSKYQGQVTALLSLRSQIRTLNGNAQKMKIDMDAFDGVEDGAPIEV